MYRSKNHLPISIETIMGARINNQVTLDSTDGSTPTFLVPKGIFFLEYIELTSGNSVTIKDGDGVTVAAGVTHWDDSWSPLRLDHGVIITGAVLVAKGFMIEGTFLS